MCFHTNFTWPLPFILYLLFASTTTPPPKKKYPSVFPLSTSFCNFPITFQDHRTEPGTLVWVLLPVLFSIQRNSVYIGQFCSTQLTCNFAKFSVNAASCGCCVTLNKAEYKGVGLGWCGWVRSIAYPTLMLETESSCPVADNNNEKHNCDFMCFNLKHSAFVFL